MRFIGSQRKNADTLDWYSFFVRAGCDWDLQADEWILLAWYHMEFYFDEWTYGWPNRTARWSFQVVAP
jgi:hypothetical protein